MMYKEKYQKYAVKMNQIGGARTRILLDGTSSAGKTTLSNFFIENGYEHISNDGCAYDGYIIFISNLPDEYISKEDEKKQIDASISKCMVNESKKYNKVVFDDVDKDQSIVKQIGRKNIYIIIVYASVEALIKNIYSRRLTSPRRELVFTQFANRYIVTDNKKLSIDTVNRKSFINLLKSKLKYLFESKDQLVLFATSTFEIMNINDDIDHFIKLRDQFQYDYILKTYGKRPDELYEELKNILKI